MSDIRTSVLTNRVFLLAILIAVTESPVVTSIYFLLQVVTVIEAIWHVTVGD